MKSVREDIGCVKKDSAMQETREKASGRVLVADVDETIGMAVCELLQLKGYRADFAHCGRAALEMFGKNEYSLVFVEMLMPDVNGLELFRAFKGKKPGVNAVLYTGAPPGLADDYIYQGVREGMLDEFLRKPFFSEEIIRVAEKYCREESL